MQYALVAENVLIACSFSVCVCVCVCMHVCVSVQCVQFPAKETLLSIYSENQCVDKLCLLLAFPVV